MLEWIGSAGMVVGGVDGHDKPSSVVFVRALGWEHAKDIPLADMSAFSSFVLH